MPQDTWTSTLLLDGLRDPNNHAVWSAFDGRYRPVLEGVGMKLGLTRDEAADAAQQTLAEFAAAYRAGKYERGRGRLRSFLLGISRFRVADALRARAKHRAQEADSSIPERTTDDVLEEAWEASRLKVIVVSAMKELREHTRISEDNLRAFELLVLRGMAPEHVATACGITTAQVYVVKNRVSGKLREIVNRLTAEYEQDE